MTARMSTPGATCRWPASLGDRLGKCRAWRRARLCRTARWNVAGTARCAVCGDSALRHACRRDRAASRSPQHPALERYAIIARLLTGRNEAQSGRRHRVGARSLCGTQCPAPARMGDHGSRFADRRRQGCTCQQHAGESVGAHERRVISRGDGGAVRVRGVRRAVVDHRRHRRRSHRRRRAFGHRKRKGCAGPPAGDSLQQNSTRLRSGRQFRKNAPAPA